MSAQSDAHTLIVDAQGTVVFSTLPEACGRCHEGCRISEKTNSCGEQGTRRRGRLELAEGYVFLCTTDCDLVASSRVFRRELQVLGSALRRFSEIKAKITDSEVRKTRRLLHNLISLNAHALQDIYSVIGQERLATSGSFRSQMDLVREQLVKAPDSAARLFLLGLKNAAATKNELAVFQKLYDPAPKIKFVVHAIHRVILNVANYFFQDFSDQQIRLRIDDTEVKVSLDYESFQVALYHLLDNAAKYAAPNSDIRVSFSQSENSFEVAFEMTSLFLNEAERDRVFEDGFSGSQAQLIKKNGQGLGMGLISELARLNKATLTVTWGMQVSAAPESKPKYARNKFVLLFPMTSITHSSAPGEAEARKGSDRK